MVKCGFHAWVVDHVPHSVTVEISTPSSNDIVRLITKTMEAPLHEALGEWVRGDWVYNSFAKKFTRRERFNAMLEQLKLAQEAAQEVER